VNPARSTGPALLVGGWALQQLVAFLAAPILGGIIGAVAYRWLAAPAPIVAADVPRQPTRRAAPAQTRFSSSDPRIIPAISPRRRRYRH
jgi:hypothetical protein